jgi:hypothetical protein
MQKMIAQKTQYAEATRQQIAAVERKSIRREGIAHRTLDTSLSRKKGLFEKERAAAALRAAHEKTANQWASKLKKLTDLTLAKEHNRTIAAIRKKSRRRA